MKIITPLKPVFFKLKILSKKVKNIIKNAKKQSKIKLDKTPQSFCLKNLVNFVFVLYIFEYA